MIRLSDTLKVSEHIAQRAAKMKARVANYFNDFEKVIEVEVDPDEPENGKVAHTVAFRQMKDQSRYVVDPESGRELYIPGEKFVGISCYETQSLANCEANRRRRHCSHVEAAIQAILEMKEST